jgi:DNA polymerase-1
MILIDLAGLTSAPINVHTLVKAYGLSGYLLPPERRLSVLKRLRRDATPHLVYTGPDGVEFWRGAPAYVQVKILPGDTELPARRRLKEPPHDFSAVLEDDLQGFQSVGAEGYETAPYTYKVVDNALVLAEFAAQDWSGVVGLDTEATSEDDRKAALVGIGISFDREHNYYLPITDAMLPGTAALEILAGKMLGLKYVAHNAKYDYKVLKRAGFPIDQATLVGDGMIAAYCLASVDRMGRPLPKGLKWLAQEYLGVHQPEFKDMLASAGVDNVWDIPLDIIGRYCCGDAYLCIQIERFLLDKLVDIGLDKLYRQLELPNVILLAEMELLGLPIDTAALETRRAEFETVLSRLRQALNKLAWDAGWGEGEVVTCKKHGRKGADILACPDCDDMGKVSRLVTFNPNSRFHVAALLQGALGLPRLKSTDGGDASNDRLVLLQLKELSPNDEARTVLDVMLAERRVAKTYSTYLKPFSEGAVMKTIGDDTIIDVIQPKYNQTVVESGRLSSEDPNAQNIPLPLRDLFRAPPGYLVWCADYNQLELRIMASVSKCTPMIEAYARGEDIHALTGWRVFGIPPGQMTPEMRVRAKTLNFGTGYGGEADILQELITKAALEHPELHIKIPTIEECKLLLREFWKAYPEIREFRAFIHTLAEDRGYSATLYGRRRNLPLIYSPVWKVKAHAQRQAWSQVVQGTAGDIVKNAQLLVGREAPQYGADLRCQVHDELWGLVWYSKAQDWLARLPAMMGLDQPISPVQLIVSPKAAETWAGAK